MNKRTQQDKILAYIREHGKLNSFYATYGLSIKQAPTRIKELKALGFDIVSLPANNRSVDWVLSENNVRVSQKHIGGSDSISAPKSPSPLDIGHICMNTTYRPYLESVCTHCQPVQEVLI